MASIQSKTIVLLTGAFVNHNCWDDWKPYLQQQGYTVIVPPWPHKDADARTLRMRQPDINLARVTLADLVSHYTTLIKSLPEKPILIGHSFGGLLTQLLLNKDLAAAGIAMHSVPPQGVLPLEFNFYRSNSKSLGLFTSLDVPYLRSFKSWQFAFANGMTLADQKSTYDFLVIPESKRALRGGLGKDAKIDFKKAQGPLLILSGSADHCIPAALNHRNYRKYSNVNSVVEYVNKPGRSHFVLGSLRGKKMLLLSWTGLKKIDHIHCIA